MSKRIIIISGGELNEEFVLSILEKEENQYVIGVDRGMEFLCRHQILPNYIVGDFDSVKKEIGDYYRNETNVPIREFNPVKDASDTEIAIRLAMTLGAKEILILGATGGRIDHLWANVQSLAIPFKAGIDAVIMDTQIRPFLHTMFAHRGYHCIEKGIPENSIPSFRAAISHGYGIELDVHLTSDGKLVVFHDDDLSRICGRPETIESLPLKELQNCRLQNTNETIPLFTDVLSLSKIKENE